MVKPEKATAVAELTREFQDSGAAVLTEYRGLTVGQLKTLRRTLGETTTYAVVKNTLTKIAARDAGVQGLDDLLVGPSAIAFVKGDVVEAARGLRDFSRANPLLVIKGGVLDGKPLTADEIRKLADLESREVLLAKFAGAVTSALSQAAALFQAPLSQAARTFEALRVQRETDEPAVAEAAAADAVAEAPADTVAEAPADAAAEAPADAPADAVAEASADAPAPDAQA